jgi:hypothetical protein
LTDEESDAYPRHVEAIQPLLYIDANLSYILASLPLQNALRDRRHGWVMAFLNGVQKFRKAVVVVLDLWWPVDGGRASVVTFSHVDSQKACVAVESTRVAYRRSMGTLSFIPPLEYPFPLFPVALPALVIGCVGSKSLEPVVGAGFGID